MRETVSHDKPKKRNFASHDIAKACVMNVFAPRLPPEYHPTGLKTVLVYQIQTEIGLPNKISSLGGYHLHLDKSRQF